MFGAESNDLRRASARTEPVVWALLGPKHGDNAQVRALAGALARIAQARVVERVLAYRGTELLVHVWPWPTLAGVRPDTRGQLAAPWPDLVIGAGRRSEPVAHWIRRQSGGRARIVHLGRPWSAPETFDLIVTTAQYRVPAAANVLDSRLPLTGPSTGSPASASSAARSRQDEPSAFADLPRPWTGVLVGGDSGYLRFDALQAAGLAERLNASQAATGGALLVTSSPRTPPAFMEALDSALAGPRFVHRWSRETANPYAAIIAHADVLVVTGDSVSMVAEALASGAPVYIHEVRPHGRGWWRRADEYRWRALSHRFVQAFAPARFRRDVRRIHERLVNAHAARWLEGPARPFTPVTQDAAADLAAAAERALALLARPAP